MVVSVVGGGGWGWVVAERGAVAIRFSPDSLMSCSFPSDCIDLLLT